MISCLQSAQRVFSPRRLREIYKVSDRVGVVCCCADAGLRRQSPDCSNAAKRSKYERSLQLRADDGQGPQVDRGGKRYGGAAKSPPGTPETDGGGQDRREPRSDGATNR